MKQRQWLKTEEAGRLEGKCNRPMSTYGRSRLSQVSQILQHNALFKKLNILGVVAHEVIRVLDIFFRSSAQHFQNVYYMVVGRRNILSTRDVHVYLLCIDVTFTAIPNEQHFHWLVICDKHDKTNISDSNNYLPLLPVTHKTSIYTHIPYSVTYLPTLLLIVNKEPIIKLFWGQKDAKM